MRLCCVVLRLRRPAAFAALFAVLLQLAVAATHHHASVVGGAPTLSGQQSFVTPPDSGPLPGQESDCPICLGLALGTTFILPPGIALDLLPTSDAAVGAERELEARALLAFRSRAPPYRL